MAKKRKQSAKARAASLRNLAKARRAQRSKTKSPRKRARSAREVPASRAIVPYKKKSKQTPKQRKASLKNLAKARAAAKKKGKGKASKRPKSRAMAKRPKTSGRTAKQRAASRRNIKKAQAAIRRKSRGTKSPRKAAKRSSGRRASGQTTKQYRASLRNLKKARAARKSASKRHKVKGYSYHRPPARVHVPSHLSWEGGEYAMENPLGGVEIFVGLLTGLLGFLTADMVDRVLATHPLTDKGSKDSAGHELYADSPPTAGTWKGNYQNLFNPTAIAAPMSIARWGFGVGIAAVPVVIAKWVEAPVGRSALQMFGFGAAMRVLGKGLIDLIALISKWTQWGQRYYDGEMRAAALQSGDGSEASLPSAGLGAVPGLGCECDNCASGVGECCGKTAEAGTGKPAGTGYPSNVREVAGPGANVPPPPPPPPSALPPPSAVPSALQGVGADPMGAIRKKNPFAWGRDEAA